MGLAYHQRSGKPHRVSSGTNVITMLWTNGNAIIPVDFRVYDKDNDLKTKDDHFKDTLEESKPQGLFHGFVSFDG